MYNGIKCINKNECFCKSEIFCALFLNLQSIALEIKFVENCELAYYFICVSINNNKIKTDLWIHIVLSM